jgi:hypothetical protein
MDKVGPQSDFDGIEVPQQPIVADVKVEVNIMEGVYDE